MPLDGHIDGNPSAQTPPPFVGHLLHSGAAARRVNPLGSVGVAGARCTAPRTGRTARSFSSRIHGTIAMPWNRWPRAWRSVTRRGRAVVGLDVAAGPAGPVACGPRHTFVGGKDAAMSARP